MYAYIRGILADRTEDAAVIEAGGVGYLVHTTAQVLDRLPPLGGEVLLHTYFSVREDAMALYGFLSKDDLSAFRLLIGVSGVGPKAALALLSAMTTEELRFAVQAEDAKEIAKAPGIGPKTAKRVILELRDKLPAGAADFGDSAGAEAAQGAPEGKNGARQEAAQALVALGYTPTEAAKAVAAVAAPEGEPEDAMGVEEILRAALRQMSSI